MAEVVIEVETTVDVVGCSTCGARAEAHERMPVEIRDLACFGPPPGTSGVAQALAAGRSDADSGAKRLTPTSQAVSTSAADTTGRCRGVSPGGENARPVAQLAEELGPCCWTVVAAVIEYVTLLVEEPEHVVPVRQVGECPLGWWDLRAEARHP